MARAEIRARATLDNKQFNAGLARMNQGVNRFANGQIKQLGGMIGGAFAVGAVVNFTRNMMNAADAIDNTSRQLGVGVEELQALQRITELTAGSADKMTAALLRIAKAQAQAIGGEATPMRAFKQLGISMEQVSKLNPAQLFELIARATTRAGRRSEEASGASLILGRSYAELNVVMEQLAEEGLQDIIDKLLEAQQIMSKDMIAAADKMEERFNKAFKSMQVQGMKWFLGVSDFFAAAGELWGSKGGKGFMGSLLFGGPTTLLAEILGTKAGMGSRAELKDKKDWPKAAGEGGGDDAFSGGKISVGSPKAADALAKIGGIIGGQTSPERQLAQRQLMIAERMEKHQQKMADHLSKIEDHTAELEE